MLNGKKIKLSVFFLVLISAACLPAQVVESDSLALVTLYDSTNGANWKNTWDLTTEVSNWYGITVSGDRVVKIVLNNNNLNGHLPPQIGNLSALTNLEIFSNRYLKGTIPNTVGHLKELETLKLSDNNLEGPIPQSIVGLTNLTTLALMNNNLTGTIPGNIDSLENLVYMQLYGNQLSGQLPPAIGHLSQLEYLQVQRNDFSGPFPDYITSLTSLKYLDLGDNNFTGSIPEDIGNLTQLISLGLYGNSMEGVLPEGLGNLGNLQTLNLSENNFEGTIPDTLGALSNLTSLHLYSNNLTGELPASLGRLTALRYFYVYSNSLTGTIPESYGNLESVKYFIANDNQLEGTVPDTLTTLPKLEYLNLTNNQITSLPDFSATPYLRMLYVENNKLVFSDLEPQTHSGTLQYFRYSGQDSVGTEQTLYTNIADSLSIEMHVGGTATHYQWLKDGVDLGAADDSVFTINNLQYNDEGVYTCVMTNDSLPGLTLYSRPFTLYIHRQADNVLSDTTWAAEDTIYVNKNIVIYPQATLTIEAGATIAFNGPYRFDVQGRILAVGAAEDTIRFTTTDTTVGWRGIHFSSGGSSNDSSLFDFCLFEYVNTAEVTDSLYGAISLRDSNLVRISRSLFINNDGFEGGAVFVYNTLNAPVIRGNVFAGNYATYGGAIEFSGSEGIIENNYFYGNQARYGGAVLGRLHSQLIFRDNYFYENSASNNGGVMYLSETDVQIVNSVMAGNAASYGACLSTTYSDMEIINCTLADNTADIFGGALYVAWSSTASLVNTVLWGNAADSSGNQVYYFGSSPEGHYRYCDIEAMDDSAFGGNPSGHTLEECIDRDPLFSFDNREPYNIQKDSPCIDAGIPDTSGLGVEMDTDIRGAQRIIDGRIDIGAYEAPTKTALAGDDSFLPRRTTLYANYPNPFNPSTVIAYELSKTANVRLRVYNMLGQLVRELVNSRQEPGKYKVDFKADGLSSGIYFYELKAGTLVQTRKMLLLR